MPDSKRVIGATLRLAGEERRIRFDFNAIAEMEQLGFDVLGGGVRPGAAVTRALIWAGLVSQQMYEEGRNYRGPEFMVHEVGQMLTEADDEEVADVLRKVMSNALPDPEEVEETAAGEEEGKAPGGSTSSKPSPSSTSG